MLKYKFGPDRMLNYETLYVSKCDINGKYQAEVARFSRFGPNCGEYWLAKVANNIRFATFLCIAIFPSILMAILNVPKWFSFPYLGFFWLIAAVFLLRSIHWSSKIKHNLQIRKRDGREIDGGIVNPMDPFLQNDT